MHGQKKLLAAKAKMRPMTMTNLGKVEAVKPSFQIRSGPLRLAVWRVFSTVRLYGFKHFVFITLMSVEVLQ